MVREEECYHSELPEDLALREEFREEVNNPV